MDTEEFKKALEGALKFFPGIQIKPEQELCLESLVVKRKDVLGVPFLSLPPFFASLLPLFPLGTPDTQAIFPLKRGAYWRGGLKRGFKIRKVRWEGCVGWRVRCS